MEEHHCSLLLYYCLFSSGWMRIDRWFYVKILEYYFVPRKIVPLSEGRYTIDNTKLFVPFDEETDELNERTKGSLLVEIQPFVVVTSRDILLLDTGLGFARKNSTGENNE